MDAVWYCIATRANGRWYDSKSRQTTQLYAEVAPTTSPPNQSVNCCTHWPSAGHGICMYRYSWNSNLLCWTVLCSCNAAGMYTCAWQLAGQCAWQAQEVGLSLPTGSFSNLSNTSMPSMTCPMIVYFPEHTSSPVRWNSSCKMTNNAKSTAGQSRLTIEMWRLAVCDEELQHRAHRQEFCHGTSRCARMQMRDCVLAGWARCTRHACWHDDWSSVDLPELALHHWKRWKDHLAAVCVFAGVGHGQHTTPRKLQILPDLVLKFAIGRRVDGLASAARTRRVSPLDHEAFDVPAHTCGLPVLMTLCFRIEVPLVYCCRWLLWCLQAVQACTCEKSCRHSSCWRTVPGSSL